ncbi:tonB-system energizer ExbB [Metapseudomonas boanensis]|uniref:Biopolymer transport protein ExbB n=1 Tax=Metapseudomonas boanensis TaxID=2822138 RepID=A0ABS5XE28_9GAMM|nr:tonB-system energizer ExbB [Pseudomonas boanensis]MBT8765946.1 tonB-system energizer ExbB [Pseudomonas boanensis]
MKPTAPTAQPTLASRLHRVLTAVMLSLLLAPGASFAEEPTTPTAPPSETSAPAAPTGAVQGSVAADGATPIAPALPGDPVATGQVGMEELTHDLSPWGMYQNADIVVKAVMIGLALASVLTWTVWIAKSIELLGAKRRLRHELLTLKAARTLNEAGDKVSDGPCVSKLLVQDAQEELKLSTNTREKEGIKERVSFRLERLVAASGRQMSQGTGVLATIGSTAPFVGLFGTVWGIMNSFIGIAKSQTTNLAVVAPGIAEALLATALGLVAAIPAVVIYNVFARSIAGYKAQVADASAQVLLLVSRDLDHLPAERSQAPQMVKVG